MEVEVVEVVGEVVKVAARKAVEERKAAVAAGVEVDPRNLRSMQRQ